jgi:DNA-directed RNA polymerase subunit beta'
MSQVRRVANSRDDLIVDERRKTQEAAAADAMLMDLSEKAQPDVAAE